MSKHYNTLIIGGGQAGLACGYYLQRTGYTYLIVDENKKTGDSRRHRYDSLHLFSPRACNHLPGLRFPGKQFAYPSKDETADYLAYYAQHHNLNITHTTTVTSIQKHTSGFAIKTNQGNYTATTIILATGGFTHPYIPSIHEKVDAKVMQLHSSSYKHPKQLNISGNIVIVGNGNSGIQIADDIKEYAPTYIVYKQRHTRIPKSPFGRWFLYITGILDTPTKSWVGRIRSSKAEPVIGYDRKKFFSHPHLYDAGPLSIVDGTSMKTQYYTIDNISSIIRCTGFHQQRPKINIDGVLDTEGNIIHTGGISPYTGIYTIGLPRMRSKGSATLGGVGKDAKYIVQHITKK